LADNGSFDILIDKIRPAVSAEGADEKKEGKVHKVTRRYISAIKATPLGRFP